MIVVACIITVVSIPSWVVFYHNASLHRMQIRDYLGFFLSTLGTILAWWIGIRSVFMHMSWGHLKIFLITLMLSFFPPMWLREWYCLFFWDVLGIIKRKSVPVLFRVRRFTADFLDILFGAVYTGLIWLLIFKTS